MIRSKELERGRCWDCDHWVYIPGSEEGRCVRYAPRPDRCEDGREVKWPITHKDARCSEFKEA